MQDFIEKNILGFDEKIFRQIVTLGSGYYVPFLKLPLAQKREIIEQLFELDIFSKMKIIVKDKLSKIQTKLYEISNNKKLVENSIQHVKDEVKRAEQTNVQIKENIEQKKKELQEKILDKQTTIAEIDLRIYDFNRIMSKAGPSDTLENINRRLSDLRIKKASVETDISNKYSKQIEDIQRVKHSSNSELLKLANEKSNFERERDKVLFAIASNADENILANKYHIKTAAIKIDELNEELKFYTTNTICPKCKSELHGEKVEKLKEDLQLQIKAKETEIILYEKEIELLKVKKISDLDIESNKTQTQLNIFQKNAETINNQITEMNSKQLDINCSIKKESEIAIKEIEDQIEKENQIKKETEAMLAEELRYKNEIVKLEKTKSENETFISAYQKQYNEIELNIPFVNIQEIENMLEEVRKKLVDIVKSEKQSTMSQDYFKIMENLVSDSGIKTQIIKHYLPILQQKVNEYLALFQSECSIELTETFDVNIKKRYGEYIAYDRFSGGEKIRIDLALMFSFVSFLKMKTGANCSLLFFDEILDSSLDKSGISVLVQILKLFTANGFSIFIVSHREENKSEDFSNVLEVRKNQFSKIIQI